jgi:hypothetical protein
MLNFVLFGQCYAGERQTSSILEPDRSLAGTCTLRNLSRRDMLGFARCLFVSSSTRSSLALLFCNSDNILSDTGNEP